MNNHHQLDIFVKTVVNRYNRSENLNFGKFIIYDLLGRIIKISEAAMQALNYSSSGSILGNTFAQIYKFKDKTPDLCPKLEEMRKSGLAQKISLNYITIAEFDQHKSVTIFHHAPIFAANGKLIGTIETFENPLSNMPKTANSVLTVLNKREAEILLLFSIGARTGEIANFFKISGMAIMHIIKMIINKLGIDILKFKRTKALPKIRSEEGIIMYDLLKPRLII